MNPSDVDSYNNRGAAYEAKGDNERAIADFNKALDIDPRLAKAYYNRAAVYRAKSEIDRAITDYSKAIEINPLYGHAYFNRGSALFAPLRISPRQSRSPRRTPMPFTIAA
jgi:tetratricopeptide (TPR) repeat protein